MKPIIQLLFILSALAACDPCKEVECANDGTCVEGTCRCARFWTGDVCEQKILDYYVGTYEGKSSCDSLENFQTVEILAENTDTNTLKMMVGADEYDLVFFTYSGFDIDTIDGVDPVFGPYKKTGSGAITGNTIDLKIVQAFTTDSTSTKCSFVGEK